MPRAGYTKNLFITSERLRSLKAALLILLLLIICVFLFAGGLGW